MKVEYIKFLIEDVCLIPTEHSKPSGEHQDIICSLCGSIFNATPKAKVSNYKLSNLKGCPQCTTIARYAPSKIATESILINMGYILHEPYIGYKDKILLNNSKCSCGRKWRTTPERILSGRSFCKPCNDDRKRNRFVELNIEREIAFDGSMKTYKTIVTKLTNRIYNKYKNVINPNDYPRVRADKSGYQLDHIVPVVTCYRNSVPPEICASVDNLRMIKRIDNAKKWSKPTEEIPLSLRHYFGDVLSLSNKVEEFLKFHNMKYKINEKIENCMFNFIIDDLCIMICNFTLFKEQSLKSKLFLSSARNTAIGAAYRPVILFENEINDPIKFDIIKSRLLHMLQKTPNKVFARKCQIREVGIKEKTKFLNDNHIQGAVGSTINHGLYYNNELVAIATFSTKRHFMSNTANSRESDYELLRYTTKKYFNVVGGVSKLIKHFITTNSPTSLISFSDNRWGDGNVYTSIGMKLTHTSKPNYWYIIDSKLHYRYKYKKHTLESKITSYDANKSEYQNMLMNGYDRIWDCGSNSFSLTIINI